MISDGVNSFALPETFVLNAKKDEVNAALDKAFMPKDRVSVHFAPLVINTGGTPGHTSYVLSSGSDKVYIQSDVTNNPALFVAHPEWHLMFDQDPQLAEKTRRKVYDMLVADRMRVQGFHYPFPALGYVEKDGNGYRLIPAPWSPVI